MNERRHARRRTIRSCEAGCCRWDAQSHRHDHQSQPRRRVPGHARQRSGRPEAQPEDGLTPHGTPGLSPCELVWSSDRFDPATGRPAGMAVRFVDADAAIREHLATFSVEGPFPSPEGGAMERYEYRVIEVPTWPPTS